MSAAYTAAELPFGDTPSWICHARVCAACKSMQPRLVCGDNDILNYQASKRGGPDQAVTGSQTKPVFVLEQTPGFRCFAW